MAKGLIDDDEAGFRPSLGVRVAADGHTVWCAEAAPTAMAILGYERVDVVVCVYHVPGFVGFLE